jgi:hypothetical protein
MDKEAEHALNPVTKEIEEKGEGIKNKLKRVETKESNTLPTAAGKFPLFFRYYCGIWFINPSLFINLITIS